MPTGVGVILVTGATGNVGRNVVSELLIGGAAVRALTRSPERAGLPERVEVVGGDLSKPDTVKAALVGEVEAVFLMWPFPTAKAAVPALEMIATHCRRIVYLSSLSVRDDLERQLDPISGFHAEIERLIERSGMRWTILRPSGFATNTLVWAPQIRTRGTVRWPYEAAKRSLIDERDIAAAAATVLRDSQHAGSKHALTGPRALSQSEQLHAIGEAIGRPLTYDEIPPDQALQTLLRAWGIPKIAARLLPPRALPRRMADGALAALGSMVTNPEPVTNTVEDLTGAPARTFHEWARAHADDFK